MKLYMLYLRSLCGTVAVIFFSLSQIGCNGSGSGFKATVPSTQQELGGSTTTDQSKTPTPTPTASPKVSPTPTASPKVSPTPSMTMTPTPTVSLVTVSLQFNAADFNPMVSNPTFVDVDKVETMSFGKSSVISEKGDTINFRLKNSSSKNAILDNIKFSGDFEIIILDSTLPSSKVVNSNSFIDFSVAVKATALGAKTATFEMTQNGVPTIYHFKITGF